MAAEAPATISVTAPRRRPERPGAVAFPEPAGPFPVTWEAARIGPG